MRALSLLLLLALSPAHAERTAYTLTPQPVADGVYFFEGAREHFNRENGGDIANTGFIRTEAGAVVIDTGPSRRYGEAMRETMAKVLGDRRVAAVYLTHAHPDHFLGNQAFDDVPLRASAETARVIREQGAAFTDALYRLVGPLMAGTVPRPPDQLVTGGAVTLGGRSLEILLLDGHTTSDLAVFDRTSGTLFAGDLVFFNRTLTTPSADLPRWIAALETLSRMPFQYMVPGHGPLLKDAAGIAQTRDYLDWLSATLRSAARAGRDMPELLEIERPERFAKLAVFEAEWARSVVHLYPDIEQEWLTPVPDPQGR